MNIRWRAKNGVRFSMDKDALRSRSSAKAVVGNPAN